MFIDGFLDLVISVFFFINDCYDNALVFVAYHYLCFLITRLDLSVQVLLFFLSICSCKYINLAFIVELKVCKRFPVRAQCLNFFLICDFINLVLVETNKSRDDICWFSRLWEIVERVQATWILLHDFWRFHVLDEHKRTLAFEIIILQHDYLPGLA